MTSDFQEGRAAANDVLAAAKAYTDAQLKNWIGRVRVSVDGAPDVAARHRLDFLGGVPVVDDPTHDRLRIGPFGGGGAVSLIETKEITTPTAAPLSFTVPGTFRHLWLLGQGRVTDAVRWSYLALQMNGDTTPGHYGQLFFELDSSFTATQYAHSRNSIAAGLLAGALAPAGYGALVDVLIPNYQGTTFTKQVFRRGHHADDSFATDEMLHNTGGGLWRDTSAITSLQVSGGTFDAGTVFSLYGLSDAGGGGGTSGAAFVGCDAYDTGVTGYTITSGAHFAMPLDGEDFDTSSMHDVVTNNTRITAPGDGYYHCAAQFMFSTFDTPGSGTYWPLHLWLYKNGNPMRQHVDYVIDGHFTMLHVEGTLQLVAGDYIELVVQQTTGGRLQPEQGSAARAARLTVVQVG